MKKIVLGNTGLEVTRLGFGGIPIQRVDEARAVDVVLHAVETGVDFIDTSRMYSTSEGRIGKEILFAIKCLGARIIPCGEMEIAHNNNAFAGFQEHASPRRGMQEFFCGFW